MSKKKVNILRLEDLENFPGEFVVGYVRAALENDIRDISLLGEEVYNNLSHCYGIEIETE